MVSSTPQPHFTPGKDPVPILQDAGWAPGPIWTGGKSRRHRDSIPDRPARSQSLYRLSYPAHLYIYIYICSKLCTTTRKEAGSITSWVTEVDSASNRNEYQAYLLRGKCGRCLRLTIYIYIHSSVQLRKTNFSVTSPCNCTYSLMMVSADRNMLEI